MSDFDSPLRRRAEDFTGAMAGMVARIVAPRSGAGLARWIAGEMSGAAPTQALLALRSLLEWDIAARWPLLACPVETINSAWLDAAAQPAAGLPGLVTHAMAGVGHFPMLEAPARFNALARSILERHRPGLGAA